MKKIRKNRKQNRRIYKKNRKIFKKEDNYKNFPKKENQKVYK